MCIYKYGSMVSTEKSISSSPQCDLHSLGFTYNPSKPRLSRMRANLCFSGVSPAPRMHSYSQVTQGWACSSPKEHQIDHKCHMQLPVLTLPLRLPQWQKGKHQVHPGTYGDQISLLRTCRATNPGSLQTHWTCISQWAETQPTSYRGWQSREGGSECRWD